MSFPTFIVVPESQTPSVRVSDNRMRGYERLAAAVLDSAIKDYLKPEPSWVAASNTWEIDRDSAEQFFFGKGFKDRRKLWCRLAGKKEGELRARVSSMTWEDYLRFKKSTRRER